MSNGENFEITEEQRARISRNFRAAKALLGRKRSRLYPHDANLSCSSNYSAKPLPHRVADLERNQSTLNVTGVKRVPLSEISNTIPPALPEHVNSAVCAVGSDGTIVDCFRTPIKLHSSACINGSSPTSNLNDDFDESVLEVIDALCEQKSSAKAERPGPDPNLFAEIPQSGSSIGGIGTNAVSIFTGDSITPDGKLDYGNDIESAEEATNLLTTQTETMPEEYSRYLQSLNERQREAASTDVSIPLMIIAGPGSGKTSTMVGRVLMLLNEGICPSNVLAMTFTTAAASEMRERIGAVAGKAMATDLTISTFHSFSLQLCRSYAEKLDRTSEFLIYGHGQQRRAIIEAVRLLETEKNRQKVDALALGDDPNDVSPQKFKDRSKKWLKFVTKAKASGMSPAECRKMGDEIGARILANYNDILTSCDALDYHDLISCSVKLLTEFPEVFKECQASWKAIVVDEFQDTSAMQYNLLRILASHNCITIVGDDDQSIFSFNGADISGFDSFRKDFPNYKEISLNKNYRSTRYIVEAAASLIQNNMKRCQFKDAQTDNSVGSKITIKESQNDDAQCAFIIDKILEITSNCSATSAAKCFGSIAILYRRQISGKIFQSAFRERKIPFNLHGVAFYRKKVVRAIIAMLKTALPGCEDSYYHQAFKALLPFEKEEKKRVINHIDKISTIRKCSFVTAACDVFNAKISGTLKRSQLTQGSKVLLTLEMISKLVHREQSLSTIITSVSNIIPQKYLLEQRAVVDVDGGKLLNEDNDIRSVRHFLLDDVSNFLSIHFTVANVEREGTPNKEGCLNLLESFIDYISERERENFRSRRRDNENSITLTTIHQSKGLEWDVVFIVKANECEIPLLHEFNGSLEENGTSVEEERRLFYVAMTRAREKLFISYVLMDSNWQMLQPSRFLKEIPDHLREIQADLSIQNLQNKHPDFRKRDSELSIDLKLQSSDVNVVPNDSLNIQINEASEDMKESVEITNGNCFLRRFSVESRSVVSHLFHQWAKKRAFQDPKRLLDKIGFVIDERLTAKKTKSKEVLRALKSSLISDEAFQYAEYVLRWEQIPADKRALLMQEKQEHFQKYRIENAMGSSEATSKQISYLQSLGCTITPTSRLHASRLIEQYKSL